MGSCRFSVNNTKVLQILGASEDGRESTKGCFIYNKFITLWQIVVLKYVFLIRNMY